ncbi:choline transport protein, partial [Lecanoromycetidae sp. Uapishka_2]
MLETPSMPSSEINFKIQDEGRLAELGYTQELTREWSLLHNFGASFSIISVVTGITTLFAYGLNTGGPGVMTVGWIIISFFTLLVGASMAEILSSIPTSGGPYFWAYMLAPQQHAPFAAWITGWFNLLGQIAVTTGIDFGLANLISTTAEVSNGYKPSSGKTLGILAVVLVSHVVINLFSVRTLRYMIYTSIVLNTIGIFCLGIAVLAKAPSHQGAKFVFSTFYDGTGQGDVGWSIRASPAYVAATGVLMSQYTILGFDASAHLCEETRKAVRDAPLGLLTAIGTSAVMGFFLIIALLFSIQDFETVRESPLPVLRILTDACGTGGGLVLMVLIMLCVWHCGLFSLTSNSRMMFAFARDGGIPHRLHIIDRGFHSPIRTVCFGATCSFLLALPSLGSTVAFDGTTSIATIGLYISYGIPIAMGIVYSRNFKRGPFNLRGMSKPIATIACLWICFITIVFCLPTINPVTSQTLNYTPVALGIVGLFAFGSWFLWARRWFTGRCRNHCRICIRQLDFLGEEMVYRSDTVDSEGHQRLKSNESANEFGQTGGSAGGSGTDFRPSGGFKDKKGDHKISVGREFEVYSAPAREYEEM